MRARHIGHLWKNKDEPISDAFPLTPTHGHTNVGRPAKTYTHQISASPTATLLRGKTSPDECPGYDTEQFEDEVLVMLEL